MREVACHSVGEERLERAREDIRGRIHRCWHSMRYDDGDLRSLQRATADLLDHTAACTPRDPDLTDASARLALRTAAECAFGVVTVGCGPRGDFAVPFPLIGEEFSSAHVDFGDAVDLAPTAREWLDAFALCVAGGLVHEKHRAIGLLLRGEYAPAIHSGVPSSHLPSHSDPGELAEMDALCGYLAEASGHLPSQWPAEALCMPDAAARTEAARRLDALSAPTADQRLLRVLLEDDRPAFERALADHLVRHREGAGADAEPRSLLPVGAIALAALAVQVHGWELQVSSGYLPRTLLHAPAGAPPVSPA